MNKFAKIIAPAIALSLGLGAATSASAWEAPRHQTVRHEQNNASKIRTEINGLRAKIDRAAQRKQITNREATSLRRDASETQRLYSSYARNGLTKNETRALQNRIDRIERALKDDRRDNRPGSNYSNGHRR